MLSSAIDEASFAFNGTVLGGQKAQRDDWKRAMALVGGRGGLGEALGCPGPEVRGEAPKVEGPRDGSTGGRRDGKALIGAE